MNILYKKYQDMAVVQASRDKVSLKSLKIYSYTFNKQSKYLFFPKARTKLFDSSFL